jgi:hypothetical protein
VQAAIAAIRPCAPRAEDSFSWRDRPEPSCSRNAGVTVKRALHVDRALALAHPAAESARIRIQIDRLTNASD